MPRTAQIENGLTQKQAARLLGVSVSFLRASSCPVLRLPGNGPRGRLTLRYLPGDLREWARGNLGCSSIGHSSPGSITESSEAGQSYPRERPATQEKTR